MYRQCGPRPMHLRQPLQTVPHHKMSSKGRTELIRSVSRAKYHEESDFDIQKCPAPQKPSQNMEELNFRVEKICKKMRQKIRCWELSEMGLAKVWRWGELCLRGRRSFKVRWLRRRPCADTLTKTLRYKWCSISSINCTTKGRTRTQWLSRCSQFF